MSVVNRFGCPSTRGRHIGLHHLGRIDYAIERVLVDESELECSLLEGQIVGSRNSATAGIRRAFMLMAAAMFIADGKLSLEDCDILT